MSNAALASLPSLSCFRNKHQENALQDLFGATYELAG